jgi:methylated-DNA-[protein]-cysteine S-methyltransferase
MKTYRAYYPSEVGLLEITATDGGIAGLRFVKSKTKAQSDSHPHLSECFRQLDEYFRGKRKRFELKLKPEGTDFQKKVWDELRKIPFGKTASYAEVALAIGRPKAVRAVGGANSRNPIAVIIPCHRVIGSDGSLTGFGGGLWRKDRLLKHECEVAVQKK